jgi:hypothetical protein
MRKGKLSRLLKSWGLITFLILGFLLPGIYWTTASLASSYNPNTDYVYSLGKIQLVSSHPQDQLRVLMSLSPESSQYQIWVDALNPDGTEDVGARIDAIFLLPEKSNVGFNVSSATAGPFAMSIAQQQAYGYTPKEVESMNKYVVYATPQDCRPDIPPDEFCGGRIGVWTMPISYSGGSPPEPYDAKGALSLQPAPIVVGSRSLSLYFPAIVIGTNEYGFPYNWSTASAELNSSEPRESPLSSITECVELPSGYSLQGSSVPLNVIDNSTPNQEPTSEGSSPFVAFPLTCTYLSGVERVKDSVYVSSMRADLGSDSLSSQANWESLLGGIFIGLASALVASLLFAAIQDRFGPDAQSEGS